MGETALWPDEGAQGIAVGEGYTITGGGGWRARRTPDFVSLTVGGYIIPDYTPNSKPQRQVYISVYYKTVMESVMSPTLWNQSE